MTGGEERLLEFTTSGGASVVISSWVKVAVPRQQVELRHQQAVPSRSLSPPAASLLSAVNLYICDGPVDPCVLGLQDGRGACTNIWTGPDGWHKLHISPAGTPTQLG